MEEWADLKKNQKKYDNKIKTEWKTNAKNVMMLYLILSCLCSICMQKVLKHQSFFSCLQANKKTRKVIENVTHQIENVVGFIIGSRARRIKIPTLIPFLIIFFPISMILPNHCRGYIEKNISLWFFLLLNSFSRFSRSLFFWRTDEKCVLQFYLHIGVYNAWVYEIWIATKLLLFSSSLFLLWFFLCFPDVVLRILLYCNATW